MKHVPNNYCNWTLKCPQYFHDNNLGGFQLFQNKTMRCLKFVKKPLVRSQKCHENSVKYVRCRREKQKNSTYLTEPPLFFLLFISPLPYTVSLFLVGTGILKIFLLSPSQKTHKFQENIPNFPSGQN